MAIIWIHDVPTMDYTWQTQAAGALHGDLFLSSEAHQFRDHGSRDAAAIQVCRVCPVRDPCLDHALAVPEPHGVWGAPPANSAPRSPTPSTHPNSPPGHVDPARPRAGSAAPGRAPGSRTTHSGGGPAASTDSSLNATACAKPAPSSPPATDRPARVRTSGWDGSVRGCRCGRRPRESPSAPDRAAR